MPRPPVSATPQPASDAGYGLMDELSILGVRAGDPVRWRPAGGGRWRRGTVTRRERDGSVGVTDDSGAARSIAVDRLEVGCRGRRGGTAWEALSVRANRAEQLSLLPDPEITTRRH